MSMSLLKTQWFVIQRGEHQGRAHLNGWMFSAIKGEGWGSDDGWLRYASCPRCFVMVVAEGAHGDLTWDHERWHAETDFPIPADVAALVTRP